MQASMVRMMRGCDKFEKMRVSGLIYCFKKALSSKCILVAKPDRLEHALKVFKGSSVEIKTEGSKDTGIEIITEGTRHLGAAVGTTEFRTSYVEKKVENWVSAVKKLATIASSEPHAAYSAFTQCLQGQWTFIVRSMPVDTVLFEPLEDAIRGEFLPTLPKRDINDLEREFYVCQCAACKTYYSPNRRV